MSRRALALALTSLAACLPGVDDEAPIVECDQPADCNQAAGEVCEVGVCWGDPPVGTYSAVIAPPTELRGTLVKTAIPALSMEPDGTLGDGTDRALTLDEAVLVRGQVTIPCPPVAACTDRLGLAGQLRWYRDPAFPGGPRLSETAEVGDDGSYQVALARPTASAPRTFTAVFTPALVVTPGALVPATLLPPVAVEVTLTAEEIDADSGAILHDFGLDPMTQRWVRGRIVRPIADGPVAGWRVTAEVVTNPVLGSRSMISTLAVTDDLGEFDLLVPPDTTVADVLVQPPPEADADHRPAVRLRDQVLGTTMADIAIPLVGQPKLAVIDVRGVDGAGAAVAVDGATVVVRLDEPLAGGRELTVEARTRTVAGRATLPLFPILDSLPLRYRVDVLPAPGSELAATYGAELVPEVGPLALALPRRVALVGRVRDHDGRNVAGATVTATVAQATLCVLSSEASRIALSQAPIQVSTNGKGEFTMYVDGDLAGVDLTYDVTVRPSSGDPRPEWTFADRDPALGGDLDLPDAAHVRALILSADHGPVAHAAVTIYEQLDDSTSCVSALGSTGVAVVRGRGEADEVGTAAVVLPRPAPTR